MSFRRALLYIPASSTRMLSKSRSLAIDSIALDLEDSVSADEKEPAREHVNQYLSRSPITSSEKLVRINALDTQYASKDLEAIVSHANYHEN